MMLPTFNSCRSFACTKSISQLSQHCEQSIIIRVSLSEALSMSIQWNSTFECSSTRKSFLTWFATRTKDGKISYPVLATPSDAKLSHPAELQTLNSSLLRLLQATLNNNLINSEKWKTASIHTRKIAIREAIRDLQIIDESSTHIEFFQLDSCLPVKPCLQRCDETQTFLLQHVNSLPPATQTDKAPSVEHFHFVVIFNDELPLALLFLDLKSQ